MKFGRILREKTIQEWRFYSVDYKLLKRTLKANEGSADEVEFFRILDESQVKLSKFYTDKEKWALDYMKMLEQRVEDLRASATSPPSPSLYSSLSSSSSLASDEDMAADKLDIFSTNSPTSALDITLQQGLAHLEKRQKDGSSEWLKEEYRRTGQSKHFQAYIYAKKSLSTFARELDLLQEFLQLNQTAFSKILKKFDKRTGSSIRETKLAELLETHDFLHGAVLAELKVSVTGLLDEVDSLKPRLPEGWESRKVYTIGCFDLFHRGHQNVLLSLKEFGMYVVAGIHDDESYFKLKNKYTIDNLETRMKNVKPFVDQIYVIPSTDPLLYIKSMVSEQDIETGACCYARGDDMLNFPGREWVESVMPVHFVPRTEACSSTLIRTIYHDAEDVETRAKAAFAKTRYDGKPIDEHGNVLKLSKPAVPQDIKV
jgi:cytidyltransferase-like protein